MKTYKISLGGLCPTLLTLLFVYLKATGSIDWSWWIVFCPLWAPFAIFFGIIAFMYFMYVMIIFVSELCSIKWRKF